MISLKRFWHKLNSIRLNIKIFIILTLLAIISIIILIKCFCFAATDIIKDIIIISSENKSLFIDCSIGYVVSYIFYLLQIYIPDNIKKRKFKEISKSKIENLVENMNIALISFPEFFKDNSGNIGCSGKESIIIKLKSSISETSDWYTLIDKSEIVGLNNVFQRISQQILSLKDSVLLEYMDIEFIMVLNNIEISCNKIMLNLNIIIEYEKRKKHQYLKVNELFTMLDELKEDKELLKKFVVISPKEYELATKEESIKYKFKVKELSNLLVPISNGRQYIKINKDEIGG